MAVQVSKISSVEVIPLEAPDATAEDLDGAAATVIVRLTDEAGRTGIGKTDAPLHVVKAFMEMPPVHLLEPQRRQSADRTTSRVMPNWLRSRRCGSRRVSG